MQQQIQPETVRVLSAQEMTQLQAQLAQAPRPPECLQTGALDAGQLAPLRSALESWPTGAWRLEPVSEPARWIVYMGKYPGPEQVARKRAELRQLGISFEALTNPELEPGLSLGGFPNEQAAMLQMEALAAKGVRTARVVQERPEQRGQRLTLPAVDDALRPRLDALRTVLKTNTLRPCR